MNYKTTLLALLCLLHVTISKAYEPGLPAAIATLTAGLTSLAASIKKAHAPQKSASYKKYETIRNVAVTLMGPLLLATALTVSDNEQRARTWALWTGIPITIGSCIYWLQKLL